MTQGDGAWARLQEYSEAISHVIEAEDVGLWEGELSVVARSGVGRDEPAEGKRHPID